MQYTAFASVVLTLGLVDPALAQNASWKTFHCSKTILPNKGRGCLRTSCCLNAVCSRIFGFCPRSP